MIFIGFEYKPRQGYCNLLLLNSIYKHRSKTASQHELSLHVGGFLFSTAHFAGTYVQVLISALMIMEPSTGCISRFNAFELMVRTTSFRLMPELKWKWLSLSPFHSEFEPLTITIFVGAFRNVRNILWLNSSYDFKVYQP